MRLRKGLPPLIPFLPTIPATADLPTQYVPSQKKKIETSKLPVANEANSGETPPWMHDTSFLVVEANRSIGWHDLASRYSTQPCLQDDQYQYNLHSVVNREVNVPLLSNYENEEKRHLEPAKPSQPMAIYDEGGAKDAEDTVQACFHDHQMNGNHADTTVVAKPTVDTSSDQGKSEEILPLKKRMKVNDQNQEEIIIRKNDGHCVKKEVSGAWMEATRCSHVNEGGWRCKEMTLVGYALCPLHSGINVKIRSLASIYKRSRHALKR